MFWRGVWGYLPANIVQGLVGFLAIVLFTRLLSAEEFGRYAIAFSVFSLVHVAIFTWMEAAMARFWAVERRDPAHTASLFASLYRTLFVLTLMFVPVAGMALLVWPMDPLFKAAIAAGLMGVPARCVARLIQERYRAAGEVRKAANLDMGVTTAGLVLGVGFALMGAGGAAPLLGLGIAPLLALPFTLRGELKFAQGGRIDPDRLKSYARYGFPIAASLALTLVLTSTDRLLLALFLDEASVGAYHAAYSIANRTLDVLFIWLGAAGGPALIMALEHGGPSRLRQAALEQGETFMLIGLPAAVGVALVARPLAEVLIGPDLRIAAAAITPWIAISALMAGLNAYYFGQAFTLGRRTERLLVAMAIPAAANVVLNLLLIPRLGLQGAAMATAISYGFGLAAFILLGRRVLVLPIPWDALIRCGIASGAMALVVSWLPPVGGFIELTLDASVGATVFAIVALILNAAGVRDVAFRLLSIARARSAPA